MQKLSFIIKADGLMKHYGDVHAVDGIDFQVHRGECVGLLGPNGAGKTTTMKLLLGLVLPTAGELSVLGYDIPQDAQIMRAKVGVVPQMDGLDPEFSVHENLESYAHYFALSGKMIADRIEHLLAFTHLTDKRDASIAALSGGMKRRLSLARALINQPELLFLDEPTTGLDPQARQLLWQRMRELRRDGTTIVLTTHYLEEAERLCDRVILIDNGKILTSDTPKALVSDHIEPHVFEIYGQGEFDSHHLDPTLLPCERFELLGDTLWCYCREEHALLTYLEQFPALDYMHRRANLEDVFLKLTGRELRGDQ